jgi:tetratricopeptide (TPR) repeat protein
MEEDGQAQSLFQEALSLKTSMVEALAGLAAIAVRREDYKTAAVHLADAVRQEPDNLTNRTSLGDIYVKLELWDKAEREYRTVLAISNGHIEAHLGLGQVLLELGENDDVLFEHARTAFQKAVDLANTMKTRGETREGSTELSASQLSEAYYALGRTKVKLYEARMREGLFVTGRDRGLLHEALQHFNAAAKMDHTNHKARRAAERVKKEVDPFAPHRVANEWAPRIVAALAVLLLLLVQLNFFVGHVGKTMSATVFLPLSLGLLVFIIAAFYLPQLLRLKVAGIELEKTSTDQITQPVTLGIRK